MENIALIGYSGHAYVAFEIFYSQGQIVSAYIDIEEKKNNPYALKWLGNENDLDIIEKLRSYSYFVGIGDNRLRSVVSSKLISKIGNPENAIHKSAIISRSVQCGFGNMYAAGAIINAQVKIGNGVVCNTGCIIEHDCVIDDYAHIAPGATLCGNVAVGKGSFIGANSVIKEGIKIGENVIVGAGTVVLKNIDDNKKIVGNPSTIYIMILKKYTLTNKDTARQALQLINELAIPNVAIFILNEGKQLIGALTDGDIRRGLLVGIGIEETVLEFMNSSPKRLVEGENNFLKVKEYKLKGLRFVPVIDSNNRIVQLLDLEKINSLIPADAILMAGGKGERLKPLTDHIPKPMLKIGDKPIIIRNIERLASFGLNQFHVSVRHMAEQIEAGILEEKNNSINVSFVKEDKPLGTIGSLKLVKDFQNDTIILMNSDLLTNIDFQDFYQKFIESMADMQVATIPYHVDIPYAVMNINQQDEVLSFSEKPRYTYYSNAGIYIFKRELIDLIPHDVMFDATHFMEAVIANQYKLNSYPLLEYWLDIGRIEDFYKAQEDVKHLKF